MATHVPQSPIAKALLRQHERQGLRAPSPPPPPLLPPPATAAAPTPAASALHSRGSPAVSPTGSLTGSSSTKRKSILLAGSPLVASTTAHLMSAATASVTSRGEQNHAAAAREREGPQSPATRSRKGPNGLGLRRTSWQRHLPPRLQHALERCAKVMDGPVVLCIIVLATLMAIFLEDIKILSFTQQSDDTFMGITLFLWSLFVLELLINSVVKAGYLFSFFFWLDLISAFSLLPDIAVIWGPMIGLKKGDDENSDVAAFQIDRIRRVSRTGERLLQLLKFVKLIRLGRIAKLFEMAQRTLEERARVKRRLAHAAAAAELDSHATIHVQDYTESSQVGSALSEQTTRKVVLLVLVMMLVIPLLQPTTEENSESFTVGELNYMASSPLILGTVYAKIDTTDNSTFIVIPANETAQAQAAGIALYSFSGTDLASMLRSYNPNLGQPLNSGENTNLVSPTFNYSYIRSVVGTNNYSVAMTALQQARDGMEQQFHWTISRFSSTILYLHIRGSYFANDFLVPELFELRTSEMTAAEDGTGGGGKSFGIFNNLDNVQKAALYSVLRTLTVLVLLTVGAIAFNRNNHEMVIQPIERMVATIQQLQKNPLARAVIDTDAADEAAAMGNGMAGGGGGGAGKQQQGGHEVAVAIPSAASVSHPPPPNPLEKAWCVVQSAWNKWYESGPKLSTANETGMLERTLEKLTSLLQVGLGEAGTRMIEKCMSENVDGDLDPLVDGTRMLAIFGFCDIRRFTDATECLREDVMLYVNEIASIVHAHCSALAGHPNKNVGDAFLVIWRLKPVHALMDPDDLFHINEVQPTYLRDSLEVVRRRQALQTQAERDYAAEAKRKRDQQLLWQRAKQAAASQPPIRRPLHPLTLAQLSVQADKAVVAFLRVIVDLDASAELRAYENDPRIRAAFGGDFIVQLGFGLHCGWAIEGPIGSRYKIDASYLSPHVNLSEALQDLTKEYGTPLLVSGEFYTLLSPYLKAFMRRVDVVKVVGRDVPMNLYAFDIHPAALRAVVARQAPADYDVDADVEVVELKQSFFNKTLARTSSTHAQDGDGDNNDGNDNDDDDAHVDEPVSPLQPDPMESPLSPGPARLVADPLRAHPLFCNPYLNPHDTSFAEFDYSGAQRRAMHASSPIAKHHLVYNFRLQVLQCGIPYEFHDVYAEGLQKYLDGDWTAARDKMQQAARLYPEDQPTKVVMGVMEKHDFVAPPDWAGWHEA